MKTQVLLLTFAVLIVCTACAPVVAAPVATPTPTKTPKPDLVSAPEPAATSDPLREELEGRVRVCRLTPFQYLATVPVGSRVTSIMFHWVVAGSGAPHIHTIRMARETWVNLTGYETFHFVSIYELTRGVSVDITIDGQRIIFSPSVEDCPPPIPDPVMSI